MAKDRSSEFHALVAKYRAVQQMDTAVQKNNQKRAVGRLRRNDKRTAPLVHEYGKQQAVAHAAAAAKAGKKGEGGLFSGDHDIFDVAGTVWQGTSGRVLKPVFEGVDVPRRAIASAWYAANRGMAQQEAEKNVQHAKTGEDLYAWAGTFDQNGVPAHEAVKQPWSNLYGKVLKEPTKKNLAAAQRIAKDKQYEKKVIEPLKARSKGIASQGSLADTFSKGWEKHITGMEAGATTYDEKGKPQFTPEGGWRGIAQGVMVDAIIDPLSYVQPEKAFIGGGTHLAEALRSAENVERVATRLEQGGKLVDAAMKARVARDGAHAVATELTREAAAKALRGGVRTLKRGDSKLLMGGTRGGKLAGTKVTLIPQEIADIATKPLDALRALRRTGDAGKLAEKGLTVGKLGDKLSGKLGEVLGPALRSGDTKLANEALDLKNIVRTEESMAAGRSNIFGRLAHKALRPIKGEELDNVVRALHGNAESEALLGAKGQDAVSHIRTIFADLHDTAKSVGIELGTVDNYFPLMHGDELKAALKASGKGIRSVRGKAGFQYARIKPGEQWLGQEVGGTWDDATRAAYEAGDDTVRQDELERIAKENFGDDYLELFNGDPHTVVPRAIKAMTKRIERAGIIQRAQGAGLIVDVKTLKPIKVTAFTKAARNAGRKLSVRDAKAVKAAEEVNVARGAVVAAHEAKQEDQALHFIAAVQNYADKQQARLHSLEADATAETVDGVARDVSQAEAELAGAHAGIKGHPTDEVGKLPMSAADDPKRVRAAIRARNKRQGVKATAKEVNAEAREVTAALKQRAVPKVNVEKAGSAAAVSVRAVDHPERLAEAESLLREKWVGEGKLVEGADLKPWQKGQIKMQAKRQHAAEVKHATSVAKSDARRVNALADKYGGMESPMTAPDAGPGYGTDKYVDQGNFPGRTSDNPNATPAERRGSQTRERNENANLGPSEQTVREARKGKAGGANLPDSQQRDVVDRTITYTDKQGNERTARLSAALNRDASILDRRGGRAASTSTPAFQLPDPSDPAAFAKAIRERGGTYQEIEHDKLLDSAIEAAGLNPQERAAVIMADLDPQVKEIASSLEAIGGTVRKDGDLLYVTIGDPGNAGPGTGALIREADTTNFNPLSGSEPGSTMNFAEEGGTNAYRAPADTTRGTERGLPDYAAADARLQEATGGRASVRLPREPKVEQGRLRGTREYFGSETNPANAGGARVERSAVSGEKSSRAGAAGNVERKANESELDYLKRMRKQGEIERTPGGSLGYTEEEILAGANDSKADLLEAAIVDLEVRLKRINTRAADAGVNIGYYPITTTGPDGSQVFRWNTKFQPAIEPTFRVTETGRTPVMQGLANTDSLEQNAAGMRKVLDDFDAAHEADWQRVADDGDVRGYTEVLPKPLQAQRDLIGIEVEKTDRLLRDAKKSNEAALAFQKPMTAKRVMVNPGRPEVTLRGATYVIDLGTWREARTFQVAADGQIERAGYLQAQEAAKVAETSTGAASQRFAHLPDPADGTVRLYHGNDASGGASDAIYFTDNPETAAAYGEVSYMDVPPEQAKQFLDTTRTELETGKAAGNEYKFTRGPGVESRMKPVGEAPREVKALVPGKAPLMLGPGKAATPQRDLGLGAAFSPNRPPGAANWHAPLAGEEAARAKVLATSLPAEARQSGTDVESLVAAVGRERPELSSLTDSWEVAAREHPELAKDDVWRHQILDNPLHHPQPVVEAAASVQDAADGAVAAIERFNGPDWRESVANSSWLGGHQRAGKDWEDVIGAPNSLDTAYDPEAYDEVFALDSNAPDVVDASPDYLAQQYRESLRTDVETARKYRLAIEEQDPALHASATLEAAASDAEYKLRKLEAKAEKAGRKADKAEGKLNTAQQAENLRQSVAAGMKKLASDPKYAGDAMVQEVLDVTSKTFQPNSVERFLDHYMAPLVDYMKRWQTATPGFNVRNLAGDIYLNWLADVPLEAYSGYRRVWAANREWLAGGVEDGPLFVALSKTDQDIARSLRYMNVQGQHGKQFLGLGEATTKLQKAQMYNPLSSKSGYIRGVNQLGRIINDAPARGAMAYHVLASGGTVDDAVRVVEKFHFNYADLSRTEQNIKRFVPFYTWTRHNLPLQLEMMGRRPVKFSRYLQLKANVQQNTTLNKGEVAPDYYEEGPLGGFKTPLQMGGGHVYAQNFLPSSDIQEVGLAGPQNALLSLTTPLVKTPYEELTGERAFKGFPISKSSVPMPYAYRPFAEGLAALGMASRNSKGAWIMDKGTVDSTEQFMPILGQIRRKAPNDPVMQARQDSSIFSYLFGRAVVFNTKESQANELDSRAIERHFETLARLGDIPIEKRGNRWYVNGHKATAKDWDMVHKLKQAKSKSYDEYNKIPSVRRQAELVR